MIKLRRLKDDMVDYQLLTKWYQEKEIYTYFEQRKLSLEEVKKKYYPRTLENSKVPVFMIEYKNIPVGIIQYKLLNDKDKKIYNIKNKCYEIDIFIGELKLHNRGIGEKSINILINYLFKEKNADNLVMSPLKENVKAIRCYEKCGFKIKKEFKMENTIGKVDNFILMICHSFEIN